MTLLDRFQSVFKSASKTYFSVQETPADRIMMITDLVADQATNYMQATRSAVPALGDAATWDCVGQGDYHSLEELMDRIEHGGWDLLVTYRNLHTPNVYPYSLGTYLSVLTQVVQIPVLVMPRPNPDGSLAKSAACENVMAVSDRLAGADRLVSWGARISAESQSLSLVHLEDDIVFERYMEAISKIPEIDTDTARAQVHRRLLSEPKDYVDSCRSTLAATGWDPSGLRSEIKMGHRIHDLTKLVTKHEADLLILDTKDDDQLAMHGLAHPIAIEFRQLPILML
jgi:hypothetical protein